MEGEIGEGGELEQMLASGRLVNNLVLKYPSEVMGDEDGVKACCEGGVDVGAGAVTDHPGMSGFATVICDKLTVGVMVLFGQDLDGGEMGGEPGAFQLVSLLFEDSLGDEDQAVTGGEVGESLGHVGKEFDLLIGDGLGEAFDAAVLFRSKRDIGELLEAGNERAAETVQPIAV